MRSIAVLFSLLAASTTAQAGRVTVEVLHPADIDVPQHVVRVAVLDRSAARNAGQLLLGTLEGAVTGEGVQGDRDAARLAVQTMVQQLQASPRFEVVLIDPSRKQKQSSLWAKGLDAKVVRDLCARRCDGIVSLDAFDSDNSASGGVRSSSATATWRFYDATNGAVVDSLRQDAGAFGPSVQPGLIDMALGNELVANMGEASALDYAARILGGNAGLRQGRRHAKAGDWAGAVQAWEAVAAGAPSERKRGKALYNLAVAYEAQGQLDKAIATSSEAVATLGNRASRTLSLRLRLRATDALRLEQQLAGR